MGIDYNKKFKGLKFWFYTKTVYNLLIYAYEVLMLFITLSLLPESYQKINWLLIFAYLLGCVALLCTSFLLYIIYNMYKSRNYLDHLPDTVQKLKISKKITDFIKDKTYKHTYICNLISNTWFGVAGLYLIIVSIVWLLKISITTSSYLKLLIVILLTLTIGVTMKVMERLCKA